MPYKALLGDVSNSKNTIAERVPTEILCKIFRAALPYYRLVDFEEIAFTAPWRLSRVCQHWRESALGDPSLWSTMMIDCSWRSADKTAQLYPLAALQTQILRSGDLPLEITLKTGFDDAEASPHFLALLETLVQQSHRWGKLDLEWGISSPAALLVLGQIEGRLPQLHHLRLNWALLPTTIFQVAPRLRKVLSFHYTTNPLSVPWPQITHFSGRSDAGPCLEVCTEAPLLVECAFGIPYEGNAPPSGTPAVVLPQLRRLAVAGRGILPFLTAPNLEYLFLDSLTDADPFLLRSQCSLKGLDISACPSPDLIQLIPHIPTLLHFQADFIKASEAAHPTGELFRVLVDACPQLVSIHVTFTKVPCPYDALYDLFVARRRTLEFACIHDDGGLIPPAVKERFGALRSGSLGLALYDAESAGMGWMRKATEDMERPGVD
ncbi:hypothetical protein C8R46DRAFT_1350892 [Mycena filopes]|nr:hypothetical protein C8R46DRAFT_1350892 [Mycena filopes]